MIYFFTNFSVYDIWKNIVISYKLTYLFEKLVFNFYLNLEFIKKILVDDPNKRIKIEEIKKYPFYIQGKNIFKIFHPNLFKDNSKQIIKNNNSKNDMNDESKNNSNIIINGRSENSNKNNEYKINNYITFSDRTQNENKLLLNVYKKRSITQGKQKNLKEKEINSTRPITSKFEIYKKIKEYEINSKDKIKNQKENELEKTNTHYLNTNNNINNSNFNLNTKSNNNSNENSNYNSIKPKTIRSYTLGNTKEFNPEKLLEVYYKKEKNENNREIYSTRKNIKDYLRKNTEQAN